MRTDEHFSKTQIQYDCDIDQKIALLIQSTINIEVSIRPLTDFTKKKDYYYDNLV